MTWTNIQPALELHDIAHYVVETTLGFTEAFYGMIAKGYDIGDFELPREQRPVDLIPANLPVQALQTEHIVNLLHPGYLSANAEFDLLSTLRTVLAGKEIDFPEILSTDKLHCIYQRYEELILKWKGLEIGETMEMIF